ncbi:hypothetical protein LY90DRAFT_509975 [Neocallimastix californiae]|uniref:Coth-domain-containing protein n=1 Tax=Neocallimastix californiae TaxID=1754190 RepID=A0A1Y2C8P9_9FUNG|nr:hypothetical protein LY90DRAFT_509975 [Neocallimastix californiae]|eukprot:ORY42705.1 hypothetical protein LY90DRAFT_509975 [Neocallimastix californiae]
MGSEDFQPLSKNVIYNVYAECNESEYENRKNSPFLGPNNEEGNNEPFNCTFTIVSPNSVYKGEGNMHLLGFGSRLYKKKSFKLRGIPMDPTLMRDILSSEMFKAVGVPTQEGAYARLIINNDVMGLYTLMDGLSEKWFAAYIHGNTKARVGTSYKLISSHPEGPFADLKYISDDYQSYLEYDYQNDKTDYAVKALEEFLDIESTLKVLAMESLILANDNFYLVQSNTELYYNPETKKYQFIPYDFDEALFGESEYYKFDEIKNDCINWAKSKDLAGNDHYFTENLFKHPQIKDRYDVIVSTISRKLFTKDILFPKIDAIANMIREDVEWNFNLVDEYNTQYDGYVNKYTLKNFEDSINGGGVSDENPNIVNNYSYGLKEYIEMRGDGCRAYTKDVKPQEAPSGSSSIFTVSLPITLLLLFISVFYITQF